MLKNNNNGISDTFLVRPLIWSVLAGVALYSVFVIAGDVKTVGSSIAKLGLSGWACVLGLSLVNYVLRFVRWDMYLRCLKVRVPGLMSFAYYIGGFAFTTTPGKAGEAVRSVYLKRHDMTYVDSLSALFTERLMDLIAVVLLALAAVLVFPAYRLPVLVIVAVIALMLPLIQFSQCRHYLGRLCTLLPSSRLAKLSWHGLELLRSASVLLRVGPLSAGLGLSVIAWAAEGVGFYIILQALGMEVPLSLAIGIYSVGILAGALSFIPGGLGSTEAVMVLLLTQTGADASLAIAATVICRIATLWFAVLLGALLLTIIEIRCQHGPLPAPKPGG